MFNLATLAGGSRYVIRELDAPRTRVYHNRLMKLPFNVVKD